MSLPELLAGAIGDDEVVARVPLGGDDVLAVTPKRTLVYRADGLLSDETVEEYGHDVERVEVSTGRRKAKITLKYGLDGEKTISVSAKLLDDVLHPVLAGVLSGVGVTEPGEAVQQTFRFSELTLVVTSHRLVKHIGGAVWDTEFEEFPYADLTGLDFEEGTVATSIVLTHDGRSERFKAPNESARRVKDALTTAVCAFYDVDDIDSFRLAVAADAENGDVEERSDSSATDFGNGPDPLSASPVSDAERAADTSSGVDPATGDARPDSSASSASQDAISRDAIAEDAAAGSGATTETVDVTKPLLDDRDRTTDGSEPTTESSVDESSVAAAQRGETDDAGSVGRSLTANAAEGLPSGEDAFEGSAFESAGIEDGDLTAEVASLRATIEAQSERIDRQSELIERLIAELRRGR